MLLHLRTLVLFLRKDDCGQSTDDSGLPKAKSQSKERKLESLLYLCTEKEKQKEMKKRIYVLLVAVLASFVGHCQKVDVIPQPAVVEVSNGKGFVMNGSTTLYIDKSMSRMPAVEFLQESFSSAFGTKLRTIDKKKLKNKDLKNAIIFARGKPNFARKNFVV